ncbi:MAG: hydrogenase [Bacillota bacterium]
MTKIYLDLLPALILFSSFILVSNKRIASYIRTFRFQSLLIAVGAGVIGLETGRIDVLLVCLLMVALKVIYIPNLLNSTFANVTYKVEKDFFFNIPILIIACCLLVVFSYLAIPTADGIINVQVANLVSAVLIGLIFMITRKKAFGQIVGFLVIENGLFATAMFATQGLPFIIDLGMFIDLLTAVLVMGVLVFRISDEFDSVDVNRLNNLKG